MVETDSDRNIQSARLEINLAYSHILNAIHPDTQGSNDWSEDYMTKLFEIIIQLRDIKSKL